MSYIELQVTTHFSFLRGASSPQELFAQGAAMGMPALGVTDRNSVAGVVQALYAAEQIEKASGITIRPVFGCRLDLADGSALLVWPEDKAAWSRLTRLLSLGKGRADAQRGEKGKCFLHWEDVASHAHGLVAALVPGDHPDPVQLGWMADVFAGRGHICLTPWRRPGEAQRLHRTALAARRYGLTPLATGDVLYHDPARRMLQDVVTAIREKTTIDALGFKRERNAGRHLQPPVLMARFFRHDPQALSASIAIAERCTFSLRELRHQYPEERIMTAHSPQKALEKMAWRALNTLTPGQRPKPAYRKLLTKELKLVAHWGYAAYFLTVHSIVQFARSQQILCQGRGSAANSVICFVLGITSIDPVIHQLLFERFLSEDRREPPDIDVDFEHERREEVIQWIYDSYGRDHSALTAVVSRFRTRGAIREVGKVLGLPEDMTGALAGQVWGWSNDGVPDAHVEALNLDKSEPRLALALELARELVGTPRHLSQHPGGFVLTRDRLADLVPIEPAAMPDRQVIEWEKVDIEELGFMKVDILGLGMLGCMRRAFDLLRVHKGLAIEMADPVLQAEDEPTFEMMRRADTLGVFQIESRAQMSMLPRMRPENFYDIAIQVAIVRPGPIQGDMVHPYLKRRAQLRENPATVFEYPSPKLKTVLQKTLGVPLFQEQAMQVAILGAGFAPSEADSLRRAMATFKLTGGVGEFRDRLIGGMLKNGIKPDFAERLVKQIEGFGSYGFPESHAASFAKIAYASSWMKCHHPDIFCAALLNAQPMGFYAPAQIVRDARAHGVEVRPVCVLRSEWDTSVEALTDAATAARAPDGSPLRPLRLGMRVVTGLAADDAGRILMARANRPFTSIGDIWRRSHVKPAALERLAQADAFQAFGLDRRAALWAIRGLGERPPPLLAMLETREVDPVLAPLTAGREVVEDYRATQLSLRAHPLTFLRAELKRRGMVSCADLDRIKDGRRIELAGIILVRQRPGSAKGVLFITLEDETGVANAILWPDRFEANRRVVMGSAMLSIVGRVQREGSVTHIIVDRLTDQTAMLRQVGDIDLPRMVSRGDGATYPGAPDRGDPSWNPRVRSDYHWKHADDAIPIKSHDFH